MTCRLTLADIDTATESPDGGSPETIEFFLGLRRAGLPVRLIDSDSLVARLRKTDMIELYPSGASLVQTLRGCVCTGC